MFFPDYNLIKVFSIDHSCSCLCLLCEGLISAFPMFGSSFFYIHSSSSTSFYAPCILSVNQQGLHFLHKSTHVRSHRCSYSLMICHSQWQKHEQRGENWVCTLCVAGADGSGPPGGGAGHPHPEAHCWNQLPLRRHHGGRHEHTAGGPTAVRAGTGALFTTIHCFFLLLQLSDCCVFVSRAWSWVVSSPCKWKTWCSYGISILPCHQARSPCYRITQSHLTLHKHSPEQLNQKKSK